MKIAIVVNTFPSLSETFILDQITGLIDAGHDVDILSFCRPKAAGKVHDEVAAYRLLERTTYFDIPRDHAGRITKALIVVAKYMLTYPGTILRCLRLSTGRELGRLTRILTLEPFLRKHYDIVHCHFGVNALRCLFLKELFNMKLVTSFHGYDISRVLKNDGEDIYRELFARGDLFLPVSAFFRERLLRLGCPADKTKVFFIGIKVGQFPFRDNPAGSGRMVRILTVGRLVAKKGIAYALKAVQQVTAAVNDIEYVIVGDGEEKAPLEALAQQLQIDGKVRFKNGMSRLEVQQLLRECDVFVLPSITTDDGDQEGIPGVLKEAMASGVPVISTDHAGIPEMITDGENGFLAPEKDSAALAEKILYCIRHPGRCREVARAARACVEKIFDADRLNQDLEAHYQRLLLGSKGSLLTQT